MRALTVAYYKQKMSLDQQLVHFSPGLSFGTILSLMVSLSVSEEMTVISLVFFMVVMSDLLLMSVSLAYKSLGLQSVE